MDELVCIECGRRSDGGRGWRVEVVVDDEDEFCGAECWSLEFGSLPRQR